MAIERYYKVYPASQYDSLDMSLFHTNPKWSLDQSQFLVEFKVKPHGNTIVLTHQEALNLVKSSDWEATFE